MSDEDVLGTAILDKYIIGRVEPHIYAFETNTYPNFLKIGDTFRPVSIRLDEWRKNFPDLLKKYSGTALIDDNTYFRDYSVHQYLETTLNKERLERATLDEELIPYYSNEFFKHVNTEEIDEAVDDIKENYLKETGKYKIYDAKERLPKKFKYKREEKWALRPNQYEVVQKFKEAIANGRSNLLMYAVMRFGKSFTALSCGLEMNAKLIVVVSAKADVKDEWKKTVESAGNFKEYIFLDSNNLNENKNILAETFGEGKLIVLFLTLQDLQGEDIKSKHEELFKSEIDLLIVDETHFGARATSYGEVLRVEEPISKSEDIHLNKLLDDFVETNEADETLKKLDSIITIHLSGTPYRILMGSEFEKEDVIAHVQFSDVVEEKEEWDMKYLNNDDVEEWDNPYYGLPQMIRFAFTPNESSIEKLEQLQSHSYTYSLNSLFKPKSIKKDNTHNQHLLFEHEPEVLDLLHIIDGTKSDNNVLSFLDNENIKEGQLCRHIVMVLPYVAACDAMEQMLLTNSNEFINLNDYEIVNISGFDGNNKYKNPAQIKQAISNFEKSGKKTITLTVNRMLTGSTVEEWDTMLFLKDTASPQEYDQAVFRLQNQYISDYYDDNGNIIKKNMKPQTILVDFSPNRLFYMEEQKALIYNINTDNTGNTNLHERIDSELKYSPVITMNHNRISEVTANDIMIEISKYNSKKSVSQEVNEIPIDEQILLDEDIRKVISQQAAFNSKSGFTLTPYWGDDDLDVEAPKSDTPEDSDGNHNTPDLNNEDDIDWENKIRTYYLRILFFTFLSKDRLNSLSQIIEVLDIGENVRIANNLYIDKGTMIKINNLIDPFVLNNLDYKIQNISELAHDTSLPPIERAQNALKKFNKMSESEIITPDFITDEMVNLISNKELNTLIQNGENILDIASKSGEFALAFTLKLINECSYSINDIKDKIYSIPTSSIAYEFTRKYYEILGLDVLNIASKFDSYDLLDVKNEDEEWNSDKVAEILVKNETFSEIELNDSITEGDIEMKFGAIVSNPPYHELDKGARSSARPLYPQFVKIAESLEPTYSSFIIPTRWFAGGKGLNTFRNEMLNHTHIRELHDVLTPETIFPDTNNRGGVCYFLIDRNYDNSELGVDFYTHSNDTDVTVVNKSLKIDGVDILVRDPYAESILNKVYSGDLANINNTLRDWISPRKPFGIESNIYRTENFKETSDNMDNPVLCYARGQIEGYVEKELVTAREDWIDEWKIYVQRANNIGTELPDDNQNAFLGAPGSICTEAYIVIGGGQDLTELEAVNLKKYVETKFARYMHKLGKASHDATSKTYHFVPLQDFSEDSDINWEDSHDNIDNQLFNKYNLSEEDREYITSNILDMGNL